MRKIETAIFLALIITIIYTTLSSFDADVQDVSNNVVRLHILANSDSDEDQSLKLKVRDKVLEETGYLFNSATNRNEAEQIIVLKMDEIQRIAQQEVYDNGYNYNVTCELVNMQFDERQYEQLTFPEGYYDALRIYIGDAKGHNWWCVMYPQYCLSVAIDYDSLQNFNEVQKNTLNCKNKYKIRFKCVKWFKKIIRWF